MSKGKCSETFIYEYFVVYYSQLNDTELKSLKDFLKHTNSNINKLIQEYNHDGAISSILWISTVDGYDANVLNNDVIILDDTHDIDYNILSYEDFETIYKIEE